MSTYNNFVDKMTEMYTRHIAQEIKAKILDSQEEVDRIKTKHKLERQIASDIINFTIKREIEEALLQI